MKISGVRNVTPSCETQQIELMLDSEQASLKIVQETLEQEGGWQTREAPATLIEQGDKPR